MNYKLQDIYFKSTAFFHKKEVAKKKLNLCNSEEVGKCIAVLSKLTGININKTNYEYEESKFLKEYNEKLNYLKLKSRFNETTNEIDCKILYLIVRALKPEIMVETGVLYGAFTAHILEAMFLNKKGKLYSIDLPIKDSEVEQGFLVDKKNKNRWELILGNSREKLPDLLRQLDRVDLFHHDSLHFPSHMMFEYETASEYLRKGSYLTSHDVIDSKFTKSPFIKFCKKKSINYFIFRNVGLCICK